jgi:hypothetical protein
MKQFSLILISEGKKLSQRLGFPEETKPMAGAISRR